MLNNLSLITFLLFPFLILTILTHNEIDPSICNYYYTTQNPPLQCNNTTTCYFDYGLQQLITNKSIIYPILCIDLPQYTLHISNTNNNSTIDYAQIFGSIYIITNTIIISNNYSLVCYGNLIINVEYLIDIQQSSITGSKIYMISQEYIIIKNTNFTNQSIIQTQCSCSTLKKNCVPWNFKYPRLYEDQLSGNFSIQVFFNIINYTYTPNNSITLISRKSITIQSNTSIRYSIIGLFSTFVYITNSRISTSGLGYPSDSGTGCGYFDQVLNQLLGCMGSGGSHGGFGGNSSPQNCYLLVSKPPYDDIKYPTQPGSGGGFFLPHSRQSSSGGGVINIQCQYFNVFYSSITSQGKNGIQGGGGGAGGTISLDYNQISGNQSIISANGGDGDKMSSSGSGGRIRLWNHQWRNQSNTTTNVNMTISITVQGGIGCKISNQFPNVQLSCGQNGSIFTSPCRPGTQLSTLNFICKQCLPGTYQLTYGYSRCINCTANPNNSNWVNTTNNDTSTLTYQNTCNYTCKQGYQKSNQGTCLTKTDIIYEKIYAKNIFISLGMIATALFVYLLVRLVRRLKQQQILSFDDPSLTEAYRKKFFRLQDLPYHQIRLYLSGQNHPFNPWKITQQAQNNFYQSLKNPITRINHIISRVIKQINKKAQYSRWQKLLVTALRYSYYPLSRIILSSMRKTKARLIFQQVDKYNKKIPQFQALGIKFHVKPQQTVASLQIFNYSKSVLDFYIQNYFPLYILLQKAPFGGYIVDSSDPFLKVFVNEIVQKQSTGKSIQIFLNQVNKLLKNPTKVVQCLNYLWTLNDINPKFQAFLWQPTNQILGIDRKYKIDKKQPLFLVFNSQNLNNNHFQLQQTLSSAYISQIQCLKHKFIIRKDLASQQDGNSLCMINNNFNQKNIIWIFGIFTTIFLILSVATLFLNIFIFAKPESCQYSQNTFNFGFVIYFALWPICDFAAAILNYTSIFTKSQYMLADAISFNLFTVIKSVILFICVLAKYSNFGLGCLKANQFIWLSMALLGVVNLITQMMWRAKIIAQNK